AAAVRLAHVELAVARVVVDRAPRGDSGLARELLELIELVVLEQLVIVGRIVRWRLLGRSLWRRSLRRPMRLRWRHPSTLNRSPGSVDSPGGQTVLPLRSD